MPRMDPGTSRQREPWQQYHLQHNTTPARLRGILLSGFEHPACKDLAPGTVALIRGFLMGLRVLQRDGRLSDFGQRLRALAQRDTGLLSEAIHLQLSSLALASTPPRFATSYAALRDVAWARSAGGLYEVPAKSLLQETRAELRGVCGLPDENIAFSLNSVNACLCWLADLPGGPAASSGRVVSFRRRTQVPQMSYLWLAHELVQEPTARQSRDEAVRFLSRVLVATPATVAEDLKAILPTWCDDTLGVTLAWLDRGIPVGGLGEGLT